MFEIKVKVIEEDRGHINPERKYHIINFKNGKEIISNIRKEDINYNLKMFNLTIIE